MRTYTIVDMIRVQKLALDNPDLKRIEVLMLYNEKYPELTAKQKFLNLMTALEEHEDLDTEK